MSPVAFAPKRQKWQSVFDGHVRLAKVDKPNFVAILTPAM